MRSTSSVAARPRVAGATWVAATLELTDQRDLTAAVSRVRRLLDLDADPQAVDGVLGADPRLAALVLARATEAGADAVELLRSAAVLDRAAPLADLARLAELSPVAGRAAARGSRA